MPNYESLTPETEKRIIAERKAGSFARVAFDERGVIRRDPERDKANVIRTAFIRDCDKIIHCPFYNRYAWRLQDLFDRLDVLAAIRITLQNMFPAIAESEPTPADPPIRTAA